MATDYDTPREATGDTGLDSIEALTTRTVDPGSPAVDADDTGEVFELPGGDILDEDLTVAVIPIQVDEFRCARCFLVQHRHRRARTYGGAELVCADCA
jgi:Domain of unknown function (DUF4193)